MNFVITIPDDFVPKDPAGVIYALKDALDIADIPAYIEEGKVCLVGTEKREVNEITSLSRLVVVLEGGVVRNIISEVPIDVFVRDIDKASEEEIVNTHWGQNEIEVDPNEVDKIVAEFNKESEEKGVLFKKGDLVKVKETGEQKTVKADYGPTFFPRYLLSDDKLCSAEELNIVKTKKEGGKFVRSDSRRKVSLRRGKKRR